MVEINDMANERPTLQAADLLAVRSRVSWGAIAAGAMVALTIYIVLMLLGLAVGIAVALRGTEVDLGVGSALYTVVALAVAFFFGGWTTSRMAVGEDRVEAVLYGIILWGVMFLGMLWLVASGVKTGFSAMVGVASGTYSIASDAAGPGGSFDADRLAADLKARGFDEEQVNTALGVYKDFRDNPIQAAGTLQERVASDPETRQALEQARDVTVRATYWTLSGVIVSLLLVIVGSLVGSGELPVPVPIGVTRRPVRT
jgi:hypothetical protein